MDNDLLKPSQLETMWNVQGRRVRQLLGELEAMGYQMTSDSYGARLCPRPLAEAVRDIRVKGEPLYRLHDRKELSSYHRRPNEEAFEVYLMLVEARAELTVLREVVGRLWQLLQTQASPLTYRNPDWKDAGLPDPKTDL